MLLRILLIIFLIFSTGTGAIPAAAVDYGSVSELLSEISKLKNDVKEADKQIKANIILIQKEKEKWIKITPKVIEKSENIAKLEKKINEKRPEIATKCSGTYAEEVYDDVRQACEDDLTPFNNKIDERNDDAQWLQENALPIDSAIENLTKENSELKQEKFQAIRKIRSIKKLLPVVARRECTAQCAQSGQQDDTVAQCMQHCMDGAQKAETLSYVGDAPSGNANVVAPDWESSGRRTEEEAIQEYKKGARSGKKSLHVKEPPLP